MTMLEKISKLVRYETPRLILRRARVSDAQAVFEMLNDDETVRFIGAPKANTIEDALASINHYFLQLPRGKFLIERKVDNQVIGSIDLRILSEQHRFGEVGYTLNRQYTGLGYMHEALNAVVDIAFQQMHLHRLEIAHAPQNVKSGNVIRRVSGFKYEGTLRERELLKSGEWVDHVVYSMLESDYAVMRDQE
ncbi:MAG: GNAT family N-acetyltransferase [Lactobacillaceae bacterium]|jgi:ribosomal-protein-alanine N-acetyltransferase|nr:GNAT family N-acetyltransferase [Lactobacillaceae bacterium]